MNPYGIIFVIMLTLQFIYMIFMIRYLNHTKTCDRLSNQDATYRKIALVVTWITTILIGLEILGVIGIFIYELSGYSNLQ